MMAKFCVFCGRPLQEGETCDCRSHSSTDPASKQNGVPTAPVEDSSVPVAKSFAAGGLHTDWEWIKKIFSKPASVLPKFVQSGDRKAAFIFLVLRAVSFALLLLVLCSRIGNSLQQVVNALPNLFNMNNMIAGRFIKFPLVNVFFLSLFLSALASFAFAGILLFFVKVVFHGNAGYDKMLCVSSAGGLAATPFLLAGMLVLFINLSAGLIIAAFGLVLQILFIVSAFGESSALNENTSLYALLLALAVQLILIAVLFGIFAPMYLPNALKSLIDLLKNAIHGAGSVTGLLQ